MRGAAKELACRVYTSEWLGGFGVGRVHACMWWFSARDGDRVGCAASLHSSPRMQPTMRNALTNRACGEDAAYWAAKGSCLVGGPPPRRGDARGDGCWAQPGAGAAAHGGMGAWAAAPLKERAAPPPACPPIPRAQAPLLLEAAALAVASALLLPQPNCLAAVAHSCCSACCPARPILCGVIRAGFGVGAPGFPYRASSLLRECRPFQFPLTRNSSPTPHPPTHTTQQDG